VGEKLDLSKVFDRDEVTLPGGNTYEIRNPEEFGVLGDHQLDALIKRIDEARENASKQDATEEDAIQAAKLLRDLATLLVIDLPEDAEVGDWASVAIFEFHMKKRVERMRELAEKAGVRLPPPTRPRPKKKARTTASSRRGSKSSTAGRRKTG
jgi:hypothetical protein